MSSSVLTIAELLPARDELIEMVENKNVNPVEKDFTLIEAEKDPYYGPAVTANGLLQSFADRIHKRAYPELYRHLSDKSWIDIAIGNRYRHQGNFDPFTDLSDQIIDLGNLATSSSNMLREDKTFMRRMTSRQLHAAHRAALLAESYRHHNVGVRGFYIDESGYRIGMFSSYNVKQHSLQPKICGERTNLERAHEEGFTYCVGLVIMSLDVQTDPGSGIQSITEPPCGVCRLDLATNPLIDGDTDITCATPDGYYERHSVDEILGIYGCPT